MKERSVLSLARPVGFCPSAVVAKLMGGASAAEAWAKDPMLRQPDGEQIDVCVDDSVPFFFSPWPMATASSGSLLDTTGKDEGAAKLKFVQPATCASVDYSDAERGAFRPRAYQSRTVRPPRTTAK